MTDWTQTYEDLKRRNWIILLILSSASYFFMSHGMTLGVILGGLLAVVNFGFFQFIVQRSFPPDGIVQTKKALLIVQSFIRLFILGGVIYVLITRGWGDPIGLTIGLSIVVLSIISYGVNRAWKSKNEGVI